jgi:hypothetical protein
MRGPSETESVATAAQISPFCSRKLIFVKGGQPRLVFGSSALATRRSASPRTTGWYSSASGASPGHRPAATAGDVLGFLLDALTIALSEDMPPGRRELVYTTSEVIRELAAA